MRCKDCNIVPNIFSSSNGSEMYYSLKCKCKMTPYYRCLQHSIEVWESSVYKMDIDKANQEAYKETEFYLKWNDVLFDDFIMLMDGNKLDVKKNNIKWNINKFLLSLKRIVKNNI